MTTQPNSSNSPAKPIVLRRRYDGRREPSVPVLLSVPDLREPADDVSAHYPKANGSQSVDSLKNEYAVIAPESIAEERVPEYGSPAAGAAASTTEVAGDIAQQPFAPMDQPRTEFGIAPPQNVIGGEDSVACPDFPDSQGESTHDSNPDTVAGEVERVDQLASETKTPAVAVVDPVAAVRKFVTNLSWSGLPDSVKENLGTLGTLAAAIFVCTIVARSLKQDSASPIATLADMEQSSQALNDAVEPQPFASGTDEGLVATPGTIAEPVGRSIGQFESSFADNQQPLSRVAQAAGQLGNVGNGMSNQARGATASELDAFQRFQARQLQNRGNSTYGGNRSNSGPSNPTNSFSAGGNPSGVSAPLLNAPNRRTVPPATRPAAMGSDFGAVGSPATRQPRSGDSNGLANQSFANAPQVASRFDKGRAIQGGTNTFNANRLEARSGSAELMQNPTLPSVPEVPPSAISARSPYPSTGASAFPPLNDVQAAVRDQKFEREPLRVSSRPRIAGADAGASQSTNDAAYDSSSNFYRGVNQ